MSISCEEVGTLLQGVSLVQQCDVLPDGTLRIATPFQYPNGSFIDVFLQDAESLPPEKGPLFSGHLLSDFGQTVTYLLDLHIKSWTTKRKKEILQDICQVIGVEDHRGELQIGIAPGRLDQLPGAVIKLTQACIRVADLSYMQRFPLVPTFRDQIEEFIDRVSSDYENDPELPTIYGKEARVDFRVRGRRKTSLVKTVSTNLPDLAHRQLTEAFVRWHDLQNHKKESQFITVVEDKPAVIYQMPDLKRLEDFSDAVVFFPSEEDKFRDLLAA
jgi:hypothetical protein